MCGIVGYIGKKDTLPVLLDGLRQLEYRGYDSAGVCLLKNGKIKIVKRSGKIKNLVASIRDTKGLKDSRVGIGHTRWATHGAPTNINAHPHTDCSGNFVVVHNGIIENFIEIKNELIEEGHRFKSETDTEVIAHLIEHHYRGDFEKAVLKAIKHLKGSFALGVVCKNQPDKLIGARKESPLIIGLGRSENFIASDVPAILSHTKKVIYIDDDEIAVLRKDRVKILDSNGKEKKKKVDTIKWNIASAQKSGYPHFMLKEISEQPRVLRHILSSRIKGASHISLEGLNLSEGAIKDISNIIILACGTAYHAGCVGKYIIEKLCNIPVAVDFSSEFRYRAPIVSKNTLVIAISQSGETADTLAAVKEAKKKGAKLLSICNVVGSSLVRISDGVL